MLDDIHAMLELVMIQRQHHVNAVGDAAGGHFAGMVIMGVAFQGEDDFRGAFDRRNDVVAVMLLNRKVVRRLNDGR